MIQPDDIVTKLLAETQTRLRLSPDNERFVRILIAGGALFLFFSLMMHATGADIPSRPFWIAGVPFAGLSSLVWLMAAGWQLQIDSQGIRRTRLWLWEDVWSWDEFRSGRVRPSISETNTFRDDQRPLFRRSVSFDWLPFEDVIRLTKACHALCEAAGAVPVIVTPVRMKVITLPMFLELEASPDGLRIRRLGVWSSVAWDEVQEIRIWRPTREWIGRLREV